MQRNPIVPMNRTRALSFVRINGFTPGICAECGCTHYNPCLLYNDKLHGETATGKILPLIACGWTDHTRTHCDNPACAAQRQADRASAIAAEVPHAY